MLRSADFQPKARPPQILEGRLALPAKREFSGDRGTVFRSRWIENHRWWRGNGIHKLRLYILDCYAEEGHPSPRIAPPYAVTFLNERATGIYSVALCGVDHRQDTRRRAMINHWCFKRCAVLGFGQLAKTRQILASALAMALDRRCRKTIFRGTETDRIARRVISPRIRSASMNYNRVDRFNTST